MDPADPDPEHLCIPSYVLVLYLIPHSLYFTTYIRVQDEASESLESP
jgi:hypothetical protein